MLVAACRTLPSLEGRSVSTALADTSDTTLGKAIAPRLAEHPGASGIYPLADALDAFAARMLLARAARRSLDIQYYIWKQDLSGTLLFEALLEAADRNVRVRLLLDDNNTAGLDATLAALDAHPNVEVRLFNPFVVRSPRWIGYLTDFTRLNRRMHNKSFTADNQATIIGGRNVGDEYFAADTGFAFVDLDVLAIGPVVKDVSNDFDRYWASASAFPVDRLLPPADGPPRFERDAAAEPYLASVRSAKFVQELLEGRLPFEWAATRLVSDDPAKALGRASEETLVTRKLMQVLGEPARDVDLVSAYFVPAVGGTAALVDLARRDVQIRVLTNSFEATDVAIVHAGYAKRRRPLLGAGIRLYELKRQSPARERRGRALAGVSGSSASSLHAKTFAADGARVFIGSFNFDERSAKLNTEMGFVIESPVLAARTGQAFGGRIPEEAYEVRLAPTTGEPYWIERRDGQEIRHDTEPGISLWQRIAVRILSLLPIDWLL